MVQARVTTANGCCGREVPNGKEKTPDSLITCGNEEELSYQYSCHGPS